jgi:hypothetical protein
VTTVKFTDTAAGGQAPSTGAVAYACTQLGFRVFPLMPGTKRPAVKDWKTLATREVEQVRAWWAGGEFTGCPVGIATGAGSGIFVVDLDRKPGINGFASLRDLAEAHGASVQDFTATMTVATPSGGAHLYFRWDETVLRQKGVHNSSGLLGPGIDVRGIGGLVKAPGQDGYQVVPRDGIRSTAIVSAPEWLVHLARKPERKESADVQYEPGSAAAEREVDRIIDRLGNAAPGTRNRELNLAAYLLAKKGVMSENDAWEHIKTVMFTIGANDSVEAQQRAFASAWGSGVRDRNVC